MLNNKISPKIWAKLVAHASFDGNIDENPDKSGARTRFYSKDKKKLKILQNLIKNHIGIKPYKNCAFDENRNRLVLRYNNTKFSRKLMNLGAISGNKTLQKYRIPSWIRKGNKNIKIAYLSSMIDDEAETIKKEKINTFRGLKIKQSKWIKYKKDLESFLIDIKNLFSSLNVKTGKITLNEKDKYKRKDGKETINGCIRISLNKENRIRLIKLFSKDSQKIRAIIKF